MSRPPLQAQLQDQFYSIGGEMIQYDGKEVVERPMIHREVEPPVTIRLPWYRRLWVILNMDIRDLWQMWRGR